MQRRDLIKTGLGAGIALGAGVTLPSRVFAQPMAGNARDRQLFEIAKRELDKAGDVIWRKDIVGIADFGLHSAHRRFHFVNVEGSNATSRGAYITWEWYTGKFGTSVRLGGLDTTNNHALQRYIVMHRASYAEPEHVERWGRLGRSNGCFALGEEQFKIALLNLSGGRLLYAEALGLQEDGTQAYPPQAIVGEPENGYHILRQPRQETFEQTNPGVY